MSADNGEPATKREFLKVQGDTITGKKRPTNFAETMVHCIKGYVGSGIFAMGAALNNGGMLVGALLLIAIGVINLHCQHLLVRACIKITEKETELVLPSFAETVQYTFEDSSSKWLQRHAKKFSVMTDVFLVLAEYGFCVVYFIFVSSHLAQILQSFGWEADYRVILAIVLLPMWLSTFLGNLKLLTPVSLIANVIIWTGIVFLLYFACQDLPSITERPLTSNVERLPLFFGIVLFAFEGITFIIPLRMEMRNPDDFTSACGVLNASMMITASLYLTLGFFTYWKWGEHVKGSAFLNMPDDDPMSQATKILISIGVMFTYALHMYIPFEILYPRFYKRFGPFKHPMLTIYVYRSIAVLITYGMANISSNLSIFISLIGALTGAVLALLLPAMLDLVMRYGDLTYLTIIKDILIIVFAIAAALTGTILAIMDLVKEFTEGKGEKDNAPADNVTQTSTTYSQ